MKYDVSRPLPQIQPFDVRSFGAGSRSLIIGERRVWNVKNNVRMVRHHLNNGFVEEAEIFISTDKRFADVYRDEFPTAHIVGIYEPEQNTLCEEIRKRAKHHDTNKYDTGPNLLLVVDPIVFTRGSKLVDLIFDEEKCDKYRLGMIVRMNYPLSINSKYIDHFGYLIVANDTYHKNRQILASNYLCADYQYLNRVLDCVTSGEDRALVIDSIYRRVCWLKLI